MYGVILPRSDEVDHLWSKHIILTSLLIVACATLARLLSFLLLSCVIILPDASEPWRHYHVANVITGCPRHL